MELDDIDEKLNKIETKLDNTISQLNGANYAQDMKFKKLQEQWLGILFNEFKKELKRTKTELLKEIKKCQK